MTLNTALLEQWKTEVSIYWLKEDDWDELYIELPVKLAHEVHALIRNIVLGDYSEFLGDVDSHSFTFPEECREYLNTPGFADVYHPKGEVIDECWVV